MRLLEAIVEANHAAIEGRGKEAKFTCYDDCLPVAALTCIDPRLNKLFPGVLGLTEEQFIWLRNAGNVITSSTSSTARSIAISVYVKGAKEIAVIGHTDCRMSKIGMAELLDRMKAYGVDRSALAIPNLHEFFGLFTSEKSNVLKAVNFLRQSPVIPARVPVHGLLIDTNTGRLDWVINGYQPTSQPLAAGATLQDVAESVLPPSMPGYVAGPLKSLAANIDPLLAKKWEQVTTKVAEKVAAKPAAPPLIAGKKPALGKGAKGPFR